MLTLAETAYVLFPLNHFQTWKNRAPKNKQLMQQVGISPCTYIREVGEQRGESSYQGIAQTPHCPRKQGCPRSSSLSDTNKAQWINTSSALVLRRSQLLLPLSHDLVTLSGLSRIPSAGSPVWIPAPVPRRSHHAFGRLSRHMSAAPFLAAAPCLAAAPTQSQLLLSGSLFRSDVFSGTRQATSSFSATYGPRVQLQTELDPGRALRAAGTALSARADWMRQCRVDAELESSPAEAALSSSARAVAAPRPHSKSQLGYTARTEPCSGNFSRQPEGRDSSLSSALLRAHLDCHSRFWPCW